MVVQETDRTMLAVGAGAGIVFGVNVATMGYFLDLLAVTVVAGLFVAAGTALMFPVLVYAYRNGGFPETTENSLFGTGLNPGALGMGLDAGGIATVFAGIVFGQSSMSIAVGLGVVVVCYAAVALVVPTEA